MIPAALGYTQSKCLSFSVWTLYGLGLIGLGLFLAIHYIKRRGQAYLEKEPTSFDMEKAIIKSSASPSACDILKPLSRNGTFPSSGAVATMARQQMQSQNTPLASGSPGTSKAETQTRPEAENETSGSVQECELVQQMHVDANGGSWRRLIVEYN